MKLWQKSAGWNPATVSPPWAFAVARFTLLSHLRDKMPNRLVFDEAVAPAMTAATEAGAAQFEGWREAFGNCLENAKSEQRDLPKGHYLAGHSVRELSKVTGIVSNALAFQFTAEGGQDYEVQAASAVAGVWLPMLNLPAPPTCSCSIPSCRRKRTASFASSHPEAAG